MIVLSCDFVVVHRQPWTHVNGSRGPWASTIKHLTHDQESLYDVLNIWEFVYFVCGYIS